MKRKKKLKIARQKQRIKTKESQLFLVIKILNLIHFTLIFFFLSRNYYYNYKKSVKIIGVTIKIKKKKPFNTQKACTAFSGFKFGWFIACFYFKIISYVATKYFSLAIFKKERYKNKRSIYLFLNYVLIIILIN